jgi:hypothetical protein
LPFAFREEAEQGAVEFGGRLDRRVVAGAADGDLARAGDFGGERVGDGL